MNASRRFLRNPAPFFSEFMPAPRVLTMNILQQIFDDLFFFAPGRSVHPVDSVFEFVAFVDKQRRIAAIINDHLRSFAAGMAERLISAPPIFLERLALP